MDIFIVFNLYNKICLKNGFCNCFLEIIKDRLVEVCDFLLFLYYVLIKFMVFFINI